MRLLAISILHMLLLIFHFATCSFFTTRESYKNAPAIFRWARTLTSCSFQNAKGCLLFLLCPPAFVEVLSLACEGTRGTISPTGRPGLHSSKAGLTRLCQALLRLADCLNKR